jgi:NADH-quinone oxidoreductase subunit J
MLSSILFSLLGIIAIVLGVAMITRRNPVSAAMLLITNFVVFAGMYGMLDAHFAAAAQIIVYAGAIMVVFVFLIMTLNIPPEELRFGKVTPFEWVLIFVGAFGAAAAATVGGKGWVLSGPSMLGLPASGSSLFVSGKNVEAVAASMFTDFLWPFELVGVLLVAAIIGAVVIVKSRRDA